MAKPYSELRKMVPPEVQERANQLAQEIIKYMDTDSQIHSDIFTEMDRQVSLKQMGKFKYILSDSEMTDGDRMSTVIEEVGEVAREVNDKKDIVNKRAELVQVIACCWQWIRHIDTTEKLIK